MLLVRKRLQLLLSRCRRFCVPTLLLGLGMALYVQLPAVATSKWCAETKVDCYFMTRFRQSATGKNHVDYMAIYREIDRWRISPDGKTLHALVTTAERRGSLHILDTADGSLRNIFFRDVELERLGTICRSSDFRHVAVCLDDRQIAFADTLSGREWKTALPSHQAVGPEAKRRIRPVWQQPMGDFFVFTDELEYQCQLHVLAARSGELLATLPADILGAEPLTTKDDLLIYTAAVANQERDGAASSAVTAWDMKENRRFRTFPQLDPFHVRCLTKDRVHLLACAPSGWTLWDLHTGVPAELGLSSCFVAEEHDHPRAQIFRHENVLELRQDSLRQPRMLHVAAAAAVPYGFEVARLSPDMRWIFIRSTKGVSLWDTAADQFLWKIPEWVEDEFLKFSPDSRLALCADQLELKILESQTGEPVGKISLRDTADMGMIHFHLAGDKVICHARVSDADSSPGHLAAWWPFGSKTKGPGVQALMVVAEFPGARELLRVRRDDIHPIPDSDGRSVVAVTQKGDQYFIEAWDLPARRPWEWIVGVPVALALAGTLFNRWRKRRRLVRT